jgi:hypothetical protein
LSAEAVGSAVSELSDWSFEEDGVQNLRFFAQHLDELRDLARDARKEADLAERRAAAAESAVAGLEVLLGRSPSDEPRSSHATRSYEPEQNEREAVEGSEAVGEPARVSLEDEDEPRSRRATRSYEPEQNEREAERKPPGSLQDEADDPIGATELARRLMAAEPERVWSGRRLENALVSAGWETARIQPRRAVETILSRLSRAGELNRVGRGQYKWVGRGGHV